MKQYLMGGSINPRNKGDQARIKGTVRALREGGEPVHLSLLSHNYKEDVRVYRDDGIEVIRTPWSRSDIKLAQMAGSALLALAGQVFNRLISSISGGRYRSRLMKYDGFIIVSGIDFSDYAGRWPMYYGFFLITLFKLVLGVPVMLYAQSVGPVYNRTVRRLARFFLDRVTLITVREEHSLAFLRELGIHRPSIHLTADPAFLLEPASPMVDPAWRSTQFKRNGNSLIGITASPAPFAGPETGYASMGLWYRINRENKEQLSHFYFEAMAKLCDRLVGEYGANLVFVPNCLAANDDDRVSIGEICARMKERKHVSCIEGDLTLAETMAIISQCDLFIGTRLHADLLALIQGIPVVALVGSEGPRIPGIMKTLGMESLVCNIMSSVNGSAFAKVEEVWTSREQLVPEITRRMMAARERSRENIRLLREL